MKRVHQSRNLPHHQYVSKPKPFTVVNEFVWNAAALRAFIAERFEGEQVLVVSNRQPFSHCYGESGVEITVPASGLVSALEPVLRACDGTWIAHGSGDADRSNVDDRDRCRAPTGEFKYTLRRIWLPPSDEKKYYDGFANGALWPLCHDTSVPPTFKIAEWDAYRRVNRMFADSVVEEATCVDPIVLVQDYHLALVPAMICARLPRARIISFWHIPWASWQRMSLCPWIESLIEGLLGSSIMGFQTTVDAQNFLDLTAVRSYQVSVVGDSVERREKSTRVRCFPISVAWPEPIPFAATALECRREVHARWNLSENGRLIVGVDRFDYSKGLLERLHALERLLSDEPEWLGRLTLVQIAAPSRIALPAYARFRAQVFSEVARINDLFAYGSYRPIVWVDEQHSHESVNSLLRAAEVCLVTSLRDGMNLVCKEFIASRDDEQGVLVLSQFAGAAAELPEALIVDPANTAQVAAAIHSALTMPRCEQTARMRQMRATVRRNNVHRWAAEMLLDCSRLSSSPGTNAKDDVSTAPRLAA